MRKTKRRYRLMDLFAGCGGMTRGFVDTNRFEPILRSGRHRRLAASSPALVRRPHGVVVEPGLRSAAEDRWRAAYEKAGSGALDALREADPELVEEDSAGLGAALRRVLDALPEGGRALAAGHSPTNEAAVFGLTGEIVEPISKGGGVLVVAEDGAVRVESLG